MASMAVFSNQKRTRRALRFRMAGVRGRVQTTMASRAGPVTCRPPRPTRHRGEDNGGATLTRQLVVTVAQTWLTVTHVARLLAAVHPARQTLVTRHRADVVHVYAARFPALVFPATPFL